MIKRGLTKDKTAQFYLIAALVIIGILIGFGAIYNSVQSNPKDERVEKLEPQLQYEIAQVLDNSVYNDLSKENLISNLNETLDAYASNYPDIEFVLITGSQEEILTNQSYNKYYSLINNQRAIKEAGLTINAPSQKVTITLSEADNYEFPINLQNIYLIVKSKQGQERTIKTNYS